MTSYHLQLLGGFALVTEGQTLAVPRDARRVIAYLSLNGPSLHRSVVAGRLWLESTEEHANGSLRSALWRLRRVGPNVIDAEEARISLHPGVSVDVDQIIQAADDFGGPDIDTRPSASIDLRLLRRELLPGWYEDWVIPERERLRQQSVHTLESIAGHLMRQRRFAKAIDAAMSAIGIDPLRETAHRMLIAIHLAEGNRSEAIRHYRAYGALLVEQLGIEPSPEIVSLVYGDARIPDTKLVSAHRNA